MYGIFIYEIKDFIYVRILLFSFFKRENLIWEIYQYFSIFMDDKGGKPRSQWTWHSNS